MSGLAVETFNLPNLSVFLIATLVLLLTPGPVERYVAGSVYIGLGVTAALR